MYFTLTEFKGEWVSSTPETVGPTDSRYSKVAKCFQEGKEYEETNKAWGSVVTTTYRVEITDPPAQVVQEEVVQEVVEKSDFLLRQEREIEEYRIKQKKEIEWMEANTSIHFKEQALAGLQALQNVEQSVLDQYLQTGFPLLSMVDMESGDEDSIPYGVKTLGDIPPSKRVILWSETPTRKIFKNYRQVYAPDWQAYLPDDFPLLLGDLWLEDPEIPVNTAYTCENAIAVHRDQRFNVLSLIPFKLKKPWVKTNYPYDNQDDGRSPFGCRWDG